MATGKNPLFDTATTLGKILLFLGVSAICGVLVAGLLVPAAAVTGSSASGSIKFFDTLPAELQVDPPSQSTSILASDGSVIANLYAENRTRVSLDQMSPYVKDAVIAIEDSRFYEHGGVDTTGIMRALVSTARGNQQGASTITQQYVNNVINSSLEAEGKSDQVLLNGVNKGVGDKLREMKLAIALEKKFTKEQILEGYLNIVFFNRDAYGIEAASKFFFSTTAKDLTLPQAALLAGLVNSPSFFDPINNPENAKARRDLVLESMLTQGKITAGRLRRRRGHPGGNQGHPGPPGLRLLGDGPVLLRLRAAPAAEQPGLRRRRRGTRAEGLPRRPDHQDHAGPERPGRGAGPG